MTFKDPKPLTDADRHRVFQIVDQLEDGVTEASLEEIAFYIRRYEATVVALETRAINAERGKPPRQITVVMNADFPESVWSDHEQAAREAQAMQKMGWPYARAVDRFKLNEASTPSEGPNHPSRRPSR